MSPQVYQIIHVLGVILLFALTFSAFAKPTPERRRPLLIASGVLALIVFIAGWGLIEKIYQRQIAGWMIVKMIVWLAMAAITGVVFRRPHLARLFSWIAVALAAIAVLMVYLKPF